MTKLLVKRNDKLQIPMVFHISLKFHKKMIINNLNKSYLKKTTYDNPPSKKILTVL